MKLLDTHQISNLTHERHDAAYEALYHEFKQRRLPGSDWRITIANKRFELVHHRNTSNLLISLIQALLYISPISHCTLFCM